MITKFDEFLKTSDLNDNCLYLSKRYRLRYSRHNISGYHIYKVVGYYENIEIISTDQNKYDNVGDFVSKNYDLVKDIYYRGQLEDLLE